MKAAEKAEENRVMWLSQLLEANPMPVPQDELDASSQPELPHGRKLVETLTMEYCLPEYALYRQTPGFDKLDLDELNADILAVRFALPSMGRVVTYELPKRMPGSGKMPVSLACRAFLLNTFKGEWTGDLSVHKEKRLVFVGLRGLTGFLEHLAACCGALGHPLPADLWLKQNCVEMGDDDKVRKLLDACAANIPSDDPQHLKYKDMVLGWMGTGASAKRDNKALVAAGHRLGLRSGGDHGE